MKNKNEKQTLTKFQKEYITSKATCHSHTTLLKPYFFARTFQYFQDFHSQQVSLVRALASYFSKSKKSNI